MPRRVHPPSTPPLPPVFERLIHAARQGSINSSSGISERIGHAAALEEFAAWAIVSTPVRGVLAPRDDAAYRTIQAIAARHLGYAIASQAFQRALKGLGSASIGHDVESAANQVSAITDDAYYYAGLTSGVALLVLGQGE